MCVQRRCPAFLATYNPHPIFFRTLLCWLCPGVREGALISLSHTHTRSLFPASSKHSRIPEERRRKNVLCSLIILSGRPGQAPSLPRPARPGAHLQGEMRRSVHRNFCRASQCSGIFASEPHECTFILLPYVFRRRHFESRRHTPVVDIDTTLHIKAAPNHEIAHRQARMERPLTLSYTSCIPCCLKCVLAGSPCAAPALLCKTPGPAGLRSPGRSLLGPRKFIAPQKNTNETYDHHLLLDDDAVPFEYATGPSKSAPNYLDARMEQLGAARGAITAGHHGSVCQHLAEVLQRGSRC